jgi:hypothetical protein
MLTAYIQQRIPATQKQAYMAARKKEIARTADHFTATFLLYANSKHPESVRTHHLSSVMQEAADLGVWLFEQPCGFEFIWDDAADGQVIVFPVMAKAYDEHGRRLRVKQKMVDAVTTDW